MFSLRIELYQIRTENGGRLMIRQILAATLLAMAATVPASAANIYMTASGNPFFADQTSENQAMTRAFGAGNWTRVLGLSTSVLNATNSFVYLDGGGDQSTAFNAFVLANLSALETYVTNGGNLVLNAARFDTSPTTLPTVFGTSLTSFDDYSTASEYGLLTVDGIAAGLDSNGAGSSVGGNYFGNGTVSGGTCLIVGRFGCIFTVGNAGAGSFGIGNQTSPFFHTNNGIQMRANEFAYIAGGAGGSGSGGGGIVPTPVPEPTNWAMMIAGFGLVGGAARRRRMACGS